MAENMRWLAMSQLTYYDDTKKRAHDPQIVRAKELQQTMGCTLNNRSTKSEP